MTKERYLPELAQHESDNGLLISSVFANSKYNRLCSISEVIPIAYSDTEAMRGFVKMLCRTLESGADLEASPRLTASEELTGVEVALFGLEDVTIENTNVKRIELSHIEPIDKIHEIASAIKENGFKAAIIEDATNLCCNNPRMAMNLLSETAARQQALIFACFKLQDEPTAINDYLTNHAPNLCQIGKDSLINDIMDYYYFQYGSPNPQRIIFNQDGGCISNCARLLRMERVVKTFAKKWISLSLFKQIAFGAMMGEYAKATIEKDINIAHELGLVAISGTGNKKKLCLASGTMQRNPSKNAVVLTALGDPYRNPNHTKQRKPIMRWGDFKLIAPQNYDRSHVRSFAIGLMGAILRGERWIDFEIKTPYRNVLCIIVGADEKGSEWMKRQVEPKEAKFEVKTLPHNTNDETLLTTLKEAVNDVKPDICFIHCYNRIESDLYTKAQLVREIADYTHAKGICSIAVSDEAIDKSDYGLNDDEYWEIYELVSSYDRNEIEKKSIYLPHIYGFYASVDGFYFMCRYKQESDNKMKSATAKEQLRCFLIATFYPYDYTHYSDIEMDCVGYPITDNIIRKALDEGIIKAEYPTPKKVLKESRITFIGE